MRKDLQLQDKDGTWRRLRCPKCGTTEPHDFSIQQKALLVDSVDRAYEGQLYGRPEDRENLGKPTMTCHACGYSSKSLRLKHWSEVME